VGCTSGCTTDCLNSYFLNKYNIENVFSWHISAVTDSRCADLEYQHNVMNILWGDSTLKTPTYIEPPGTPSGYMRPVMYCQNNLHWNSATNNWLNCGSWAPNRKVDFLYEQDCTYDARSYYNWFVFKVPVSAMFDGNQDNIPELAVSFGD